MTYRVRDDVTREQLVALVEALNPFYAFGAVLGTANDTGGYANVTLYAGEPAKVHQNESGGRYKTVAEPEDYDNDICLHTLDEEGVVVGVTGGWRGVSASYIGPQLTAKNFFEARDAFRAVVEDKK